MSIFVRPEDRRPFKNIGDALQSGLTKGIEQGLEQDLIDRLIQKAQGGQGDYLDNLLQNIPQSGLPLDRQQAFQQTLQPQLQQRQQQRQMALEQARSQRQLEGQGMLENLKQQNRLELEERKRYLKEQPTQTDVLINDIIKQKYGLNEPNTGLNRQTKNNLEEPTTPGEPPNSPMITLKDLPDSELGLLSAHSDPRIRSIADSEMKQRKEQRRQFEANRVFESKRSDKFFEEIDKDRRAVLDREFAGKLLLDAVQEGDLGFFSGDNLARVTGIGLFKTAKGQQFRTAAKEYLLGNIQRAGSRPNQWIEQQINDAIAKIGDSKNAQVVSSKIFLARNELDKKRVELADQAQQEYMDSLGYVPANISSIVEQRLRPFADETQLNLAYDLKKIDETEKSLSQLKKGLNKKVSRGTPLTKLSAQLFFDKNNGDVDKGIENAKRLGYTIPTIEQFRRYEE